MRRHPQWTVARSRATCRYATIVRFSAWIADLDPSAGNLQREPGEVRRELGSRVWVRRGSGRASGVFNNFGGALGSPSISFEP
jgi:hypothetical protein